jgi:hypothetical protein
MPFTIDEYTRLRPYLYHLTARANLSEIRRTGELLSAATLLTAARLPDAISERRVGPRVIEVGGREIVLRDQRPLHKGPIIFPPGYTFEKFVAYLNAHVFFWAGNSSGPAGAARSYGLGHFETYKHERPAILRVRFQSLITANPNRTPLFCRFNSGAPRCSRGKKAPRGADTFKRAEDFERSAANAAEVTFRDNIVLPDDVEVGSRFGDRGWVALCAVTTP